MKTNLDPHEIAQTSYALGEEFATMVDSETRNKYAMDTGNGYTGLIELMAEAATALEQAFEDFRGAGREYTGVFLYEAVPNMASNIAGFLALHSVNDLTASELRKLAEAAIAEDLVPLPDPSTVPAVPTAVQVRPTPLTTSISIVWHDEDVIHRGTELGFDLTPAQASYVLEGMKKRHDCNEGINWEVMDVWISDAVEKAEEINADLDTEVTQNDVEVQFIDTNVKQSVITLPGVVFLRELEDYVCDAVEKAIRVALQRPVTGESFEIDVEGIKARYDLVRFALVFDSGVLYGVSRTSFEAGGDVGVITSGYSSSMRAYGPPEGWLSNEAWAATFRNDNGGYGSDTLPERLRKQAAEVDDLLQASGGPMRVSDQLGCSASHITASMVELADAMESLSIN